MAAGEQWAETGIGAVVLAGAAAFLVYALSQGGGFQHGRGYELVARFGQVGALAAGSDVRVAGVKIGSVSKIELDPKTFQAETYFLIDPKIKLPTDSTVKITSDGLLGGQHVAVEPGGSSDDLKPGSQFQNTQGAVDLFGLIGQVMRPQGSGGASATSAAPPASAR